MMFLNLKLDKRDKLQKRGSNKSNSKDIKLKEKPSKILRTLLNQNQ